MLLKEFYRTVILSEDTAVTFLREHNLLDAPQEAAPCHRCGSTMLERKKRDRSGNFRPVLRCTRRGCQTSRSIRKGNEFFHYKDINNRLNCRLSLSEILELVLLFVLEIPTDTAVTLTGKSFKTVTDWFNMCREVCGTIVSFRTRGQMVGTEENPIRIDETRFVGKKYIRNKSSNGEQMNGEVSNTNSRGTGIDGPWIFGLRQGSDFRYFYIQQRDRNTLIPIIEQECQSGSVIISDESPSYDCLTSTGYRHSIVNQLSLRNVQAVEQTWLDAKTRAIKKMNIVSQDQFQSHLDHFCWKVLRKNESDMFLAFLSDIQSIYR